MVLSLRQGCFCSLRHSAALAYGALQAETQPVHLQRACPAQCTALQCCTADQPSAPGFSGATFFGRRLDLLAFASFAEHPLAGCVEDLLAPAHEISFRRLLIQCKLCCSEM